MTALTTRVHVFCEGQTEETFVREVLQTYFNRIGIFLNAIVVRTSKTGKGGVNNYAKIKWQIENKCKEDTQSWVTTLIDFYGSTHDFPDKQASEALIDPYRKVQCLEQAFRADINQANFISNLLLHEYEALLFTDVSQFSNWFASDVVVELEQEKSAFESPEYINDSAETAPSKRIIRLCKGYDKPVHGAMIAMDIGLDKIRASCRHFREWLDKIEALVI